MSVEGIIKRAKDVVEDLQKAHPDSDEVMYAIGVIEELVDDITYIRPIDPPHKALLRKEQIKTIVDYYMANLATNQECVREMLEYHWNCMSDGTLEDYVDMVNEEKEKAK